MTSRCPQCGKSLRAHLDGGACGILRRSGLDAPRARPTGGRLK